MASFAEQEYTKRIILVGAGLANLRVISQAEEFHALGAQLILVDINSFWFFANMATEAVSGYYGLKDFYLNLRLFAKQSGIEFIQDEVRSLLPRQKKIMTFSGRMIEYDLISFAIGAIPDLQASDIPAEGSFSVKPLKNVLQIRNEMETCLELFPDKCLDLVVIGAGASGVEYALNLAELLEARQPPAGWQVTLIEKQSCVLPGFPQRAAGIVRKMLMAYNIKVRTGVEIQHVQSNRIVLEYGEILDFDLAIVASGERVSDLFIRAGLETDEYGALCVEASLRAQNYSEIFAGGDCAHVKGCFFKKSTQNALQQGSVLEKNLLATLQGRPLVHYSGLKHAQQFLSLGRSNALWLTGHLILHGAWVVKLKHWRDRRIMRKLQNNKL